MHGRNNSNPGIISVEVIKEEFFFDKKRKRHGSSFYKDEGKLSAAVGSFHWLPEEANINNIVKNRLPKVEYNNSFHYASGNQLFRIIDGQIEMIAIEDVENFKLTVSKIMINDEFDYLQKVLTEEQVNDLIVSAKSQKEIHIPLSLRPSKKLIEEANAQQSPLLYDEEGEYFYRDVKNNTDMAIQEDSKNIDAQSVVITQDPKNSAFHSEKTLMQKTSRLAKALMEDIFPRGKDKQTSNETQELVRHKRSHSL